jgi:hypothetical protein
MRLRIAPVGLVSVAVIVVVLLVRPATSPDLRHGT